jgi:hypothetical protein
MAYKLTTKKKKEKQEDKWLKIGIKWRKKQKKIHFYKNTSFTKYLNNKKLYYYHLFPAREKLVI